MVNAHNEEYRDEKYISTEGIYKILSWNMGEF